MDLNNSNSSSFASRRSCEANTSESETSRQFGFSKLVDDLMTKRNIFCKCCSTLSSNSRDGFNDNSNVVTIDLESDIDEKVDLQKANVISFKELMSTLENEVEKRFESISLYFRNQLVEEKEKNIGLKEQILRVREEFIPMAQYNDLKESYEKKIRDLGLGKNVHQFDSPIMENGYQESRKKATQLNNLENINVQLDELRKKLEKDFEKRLLEQRNNLEKEHSSKMDQLRTELTQCLFISTDKEVQTDNEIDHDDETMIDQNNNSQRSSEPVNESGHLESTLMVDKEAQTDSEIILKTEPMDQDNISQELANILNNQTTLINNLMVVNSQGEGSGASGTTSQLDEPSSSRSTQVKRKLVSTDFHDFPPCSWMFDLTVLSSSLSKTLKKVTGSFDFYEIPWDHLAVRICTRCKWAEQVLTYDYAKHFKSKHSSVRLENETIISQYNDMIIYSTIYESLNDDKTRAQLIDDIVDDYCYNIPEDYLIVQICSICQWVQSCRRNSYRQHFKDYHRNSGIGPDIVISQFQVAVMEKVAFESAKTEWERKENSNSR